MKKRNTEGFALAYVVIVITVLTTLAVGLMSISLRILMAQEATTKRMQEKYEAQGQVELFVAELLDEDSGILDLASPSVIDEDKFTTYDSQESALNDPEAITSINAALNSAANDIETFITSGYPGSQIVSDSGNLTFVNDDAFFSCEVEYKTTIEDSSTSVHATIFLECELATHVIPVQIKYEDMINGGHQYKDGFMYGYRIVSSTTEFTDYEIVSEEGGAA